LIVAVAYVVGPSGFVLPNVIEDVLEEKLEKMYPVLGVAKTLNPCVW
jgi:hypothetical protein